MVRKKLSRLKIALISICFLLSFHLGLSFAATQDVNLSVDNDQQVAGDSFLVDINYSTSDNEKETTGIAFHVHYNSSKLTLNSIDNPFKGSTTQIDINDNTDLDSDPTTDMYALLAWSDPFGAAWPGTVEVFPLLLGQLNFTVKAGAYNGAANINVSFSSNAAGYTGNSTDIVLTVTGGKDAPSTPVLSPETGYYKDAVSVSATVDAAPITTYYTIDGSDPDETDTPYAGAFNVDGADGDVVTVKMRSYDAAEPIWGDIGSAVYTFDKADPTGVITTPAADAIVTATALDITGTAADSGSGVDKVEVSIDNGTTFDSATGTATWTYSATLEKGANKIVVKITDKAGNVATETGSTITYYPPLSLTVDGNDVTGETVFVPNTAGNNTKTITVSGGSENYTTYTWKPENKAGVGALTDGASDEEKIYTAELGNTDTHKITVQDPIDTTVFTADVTMEVVDFSATADKTIGYVGETVTFTAQGNTGKVTWTAKSGGDIAGTPVLSGTNDETAKIVLTKAEAGTFQLTATDQGTGISFDLPVVTVYTVPDFGTLPTEKIEIQPGEDSAEFTVSGGDGTYNWTVAGPQPVAGGTKKTFTFPAPSTGAFAGTYTITAAGSGGYTHTFDIYVPLTIKPDDVAVEMTSKADPYPFTITGAADPTPYTVTVDSLDDVQDDVTTGTFAGNTATYAFDPTDYTVTSDTGDKSYSLKFDITGYTNPEMVDIRVAPDELYTKVTVPGGNKKFEIDLTNKAEDGVKKLFGTRLIKIFVDNEKGVAPMQIEVRRVELVDDVNTSVVDSGKKYDLKGSSVQWDIIKLETGTCVTIPVPCTEDEARQVRAGTMAVFYQNGNNAPWKKVDVNPNMIDYKGNNSLIEVEICEWSSNQVILGSLSGSSGSTSPSGDSDSDCFISSLDGNSNSAWLAMIAILAMVTAVAAVRRSNANR